MEEVDVLPKGSLNRDVIAKIAAMWAIELGAPETTDEGTWTKYLKLHYKSVLEEYNTKLQADKEKKAAEKLAKKGKEKVHVDTPFKKPIIAGKGGEQMPQLDLYKGGAVPEHGLSKEELLLSMLSKNQQERQMMLDMLSQQNDD